jgi:hypothetical protein
MLAPESHKPGREWSGLQVVDVNINGVSPTVVDPIVDEIQQGDSAHICQALSQFFLGGALQAISIRDEARPGRLTACPGEAHMAWSIDQEASVQPHSGVDSAKHQNGKAERRLEAPKIGLKWPPVQILNRGMLKVLTGERRRKYPAKLARGVSGAGRAISFTGECETVTLRRPTATKAPGGSGLCPGCSNSISVRA